MFKSGKIITSPKDVRQRNQRVSCPNNHTWINTNHKGFMPALQVFMLLIRVYVYTAVNYFICYNHITIVLSVLMRFVDYYVTWIIRTTLCLQNGLIIVLKYWYRIEVSVYYSRTIVNDIFRFGSTNMNNYEFRQKSKQLWRKNCTFKFLISVDHLKKCNIGERNLIPSTGILLNN